MSTPDYPLAPEAAPAQAKSAHEVFVPDSVLPAMPTPPEPLLSLGRKRMRNPEDDGTFAARAHSAAQERVATVHDALVAAGVPMRTQSEVASGVLTAQRDPGAAGTLYVWLPHAPAEKLPRVERERAGRKRQDIAERGQP